MKKILTILTFLIGLIPVKMACQSRYKVNLTEFSTSRYDEFCPVQLNDQIVFCSNREHELLITYQNGKNLSLFNLFKVHMAPGSDQGKPDILSKNLSTPFNDGPAAFTEDGNLMVYSRNLDVNVRTKNMTEQNNNLGLFFAEWVNGDWMPSSAFPFNNKDYSITTPCFSPDGQTLYFGSDMPGGYGGADLYRSEKIDGKWSVPVNLGEIINTSGNEVYPFMAENGNLFFASDGHGGLGHKDIFLTRWSGSGWIDPIPLDAPINSEEDDFGIITDPDFSEGYFSSSRAKTDDIYRFSTLVPQLYDCDTLLKNQYCFEFWDEQYPGFDSLPVIYEWEFSDSTRIRGLRVEHCFPGAGKYWAKLNIIDYTTSIVFFTQSTMEFELEDHVQPFIKSSDIGIVNTAINFSGLDSNLPQFIIKKYVWDFGDGEYQTGPEISHQYKMPGVYAVKLGLIGVMKGEELQETKCIVKVVTVVPDNSVSDPAYNK